MSSHTFQIIFKILIRLLQIHMLQDPLSLSLSRFLSIRDHKVLFHLNSTIIIVKNKKEKNTLSLN